MPTHIDTVVLVYGAFADGSCRSKVISCPAKAGATSIAMQSAELVAG